MTATEDGLRGFVEQAIGGPVHTLERTAVGSSRVTLLVEAEDADVWADEPIWKDGEVVGFVTSGGYAHFSEKSVALGFVPIGMIEDGARFEIEILGEMRPATLITEPLFDPEGARMRG